MQGFVSGHRMPQIHKRSLSAIPKYTDRPMTKEMRHPVAAYN